MHDILAHATHHANWGRSLHYAAGIAKILDASLTGVFVSEPVQPSPLESMAQFPEFFAFVAEEVRSAQRAEPAFRKWAAGHEVPRARWQVAEGELSAVLAYVANWHDLLILETGTRAPWSSISELGEVLLTCGVPCLLVPDSYTRTVSVETMAIAWNGSVESIRAIHAAMPLLKRAKRIVLIHGERVAPYSLVDCKPPLNIEKHLEQHGLDFSKRAITVAPDLVGSELLTAAWEARADMLVMGAYGRARFSEWIFGGATRHVLEHAKLPVLMRH